MNCSKLLCVKKDSDAGGVRDLSYWKVADFDEICHEDSVESLFLQNNDGVEELFGNEATRRTYRSFWKFDVYKGNDTFILLSAHLDSIMATIIE